MASVSPYNELVKEYFCADGKDIKTSEVYDENDPYVNRVFAVVMLLFFYLLWEVMRELSIMI